MTLDEWSNKVHQLAKEKGWWEIFENGTVIPRNPLEVAALVHSEISEAVEEYRNGNMPPIYQCAAIDPPVRTPSDTATWNPQIKPEGWAIEYADAVIRIMDIFAAHGVSLEQAIAIKHSYNQTRPERHGGKKY